MLVILLFEAERKLLTILFLKYTTYLQANTVREQR